MSLIELKKINKFVGPDNNQQHILKDVSLSIEQGEFISIIGQSGSGKSTLMNLLGCLDQASSGQFLFRGQDISLLSNDELSSLRLKSFGFVFQRYNLLNALSALENVALPAIYSNLNAENRADRALQLLAQLGLADKSDNKPNEMSGGQQQRVSIARALMNGGEVILADEPTGALDSESGEMVLQILEDLHRQGHTIILVTHDKSIAERADRVIEIKDGRILSDTQRKSLGQVSPSKVFHADMKFSFVSQVYEAMKMSLHSIFANRLRSFLTMLGIIIGICSVTIVIAIGNGAKEKFLNDWGGLKTATLEIYPGGTALAASASRLNMDDLNALNEMKEIIHVSPHVSLSGNMIYQNRNIDVSATGADGFYLKIRNMKVQHGRFFTQSDVEQRSQIVVIDKQAAEKLFGQQKLALGKTVLFNKRSYEVVGIAEPQYSSGSSQIWMPYNVLMSQISSSDSVNLLTAVLHQNTDSVKAEKKVRQLLIARHGVEDFDIYNSDESMKSFEKYLGTMTFFISAVAFISLVVGGVGVMNIMLVSVTERIKEIGLRIAVGARQSDVQAQFLIESAVLCLIGGVIGVAIALIASFIFNAISSDYKMVFSWSVAIIALLFSTLVGLIFGYMPAKRAANLKPIEALAHE